MLARISGYLVVAGCLVSGVPLQAHHSLAGVYDMHKETELAGSVAKIRFSNPHGSMTVAVKNADGSMTEWVLTLGSATALAQRGIGARGANALHAGDEVKVRIIPARDGSPLGFLKSVTMPDGRVIQIASNNPEND